MKSKQFPFQRKLLVALLLPLWTPVYAQQVFNGPDATQTTLPSAGINLNGAFTLQIGNGGVVTGTDDGFGNLQGGPISYTGGSTLFINSSTNMGFSAMSGAGNLTKSGAGSLLVTGATWTHSGDTTINAGTINGAIASSGQLIMNGGQYATGGASSFSSLAGTGGAINISGTGSLTVGGDNSSTTYDGTFGGSGTLVKQGTGTLTLTQIPGHTGSTTISAGTLRLGDGSGVTGAMGGDIINNSALVVDTSALGISLGNLSGTGTLTKNGNGGLISSGPTWTHSGDTMINAGSLGASINSAGRLIVNGGQFDTGGSTFGSLAGTGGTVNINSGTLTVGGDNSSTTYSGQIDTGGLGNLVKEGTGTLTLVLVPDHGGTTTISAGTLQIGDGTGVTGTISGDIINNSALVFDTSAAGITLGNLSGTGTLTKNGAGQIISAGPTWTHSGNTTINAGGIAASINSTGRLIVNGGQFDTGGSTFGSLAGTGGTVNINSGTLTVGGDNSSTTYSGQIDTGGLGNLVKEGTGTLTLVLVPDHGGTTTISAGTLQIGDGTGVTGTISGDIINNSALVFDTSAAGITLGNLSGTGTLTKNGAGQIISAGPTWTHSGNTTINAGGIGASINSTGRLVLNGGQLDTGNSTFGSIASAGGNAYINGGGTMTVGSDNTSTTYSGELGGDGTLIKNGSGTLTFTGVSASTGAITVNGGMVVMNGSTTATVNLNAGGSLGGSGSVGGLAVAAGGIVAPGNSIGTLTVNGNVAFNAGSIYRVEADAAGASDRINATGTATITGGTVDVQAGAGTYNPATTYTILNAAGGVTGAFTTVTSNLAFLTPSLTYDPNNVFLTLTRNTATFQSVAITPNQIAVSNMLGAVFAPAPGGDLGAVNTAITGLSAEQARAAYDAIGGASIVELRRANMAFARGFGDTLDARIRQPAASRVALAGPVTPLSQEEERGFWIKAGASGYKADGDGNAFGNTVRGGGITLGVDASLSRDAVAGIAISYGKGRLEFDGIADNGQARNVAIGAYGRYVSGPWAFKGFAAYAQGDNEMNRNVSFGAISRTASGEFDSRSGTVYGEASYDIPMQGYRLRPLAGLSWTHARQDAYSETGAGALSLNVAAETTDSLRSVLGVKTLHSSGNLRIEPRLLWSHEFGDLYTPLQAQLSGAGAAGHFTVSGVRLKRDALSAGLVLAGNVGKATELFVDVQVDGNSRQTAYAAHAGMRVKW